MKEIEFTVKLKNGEEVKVTWHRNWLSYADMDHLEFRGSMTNTGYKSEFLHHTVPVNLEQVKEYAQTRAQELWDENEQKYGRQLSMLEGL